MAATQQQKGEAFRALHEGPAFVIPNPWDAGAARVLEALGFRALATTSSGFAFTLGRPDGQATLDEVIEHTRTLCAVTDLPVSVDLENGHGPSPEDAAAAITRAAEAGAAGGSIEDFDREDAIYEIEHAAERVAAAAEAVTSFDFPFVLTARSENQLHGNKNLDETIERLQAYERAGADVVFAPGLRTMDEIRVVRQATSKPLNVLARPGMSKSEIVKAGAQRISVGGQLTWVAVAAMASAAEEMLHDGDFSSLDAPVQRIREWLGG